MLPSIRALICVALSALTSSAFSEYGDVSNPGPETTTLPPTARFEIVQSPLAAPMTFRLDRYTGKVWRLAITQEGEDAWDETEIVKAAKVQSSARPRFQLFISGITGRDTFPMDTDTGNSCVLATGKKKAENGTEYEALLWEPFVGQ